jgi:hypothetical protein
MSSPVVPTYDEVAAGVAAEVAVIMNPTKFAASTALTAALKQVIAAINAAAKSGMTHQEILVMLRKGGFNVTTNS